MPQTYKARLAAAVRRREKVLGRIEKAHDALAYEDAVIYLAKAHVEAGLGHVLTPDPPIRPWEGARPEKVAPDCRVCGANVTSVAGKQPCRGDTRKCPAPVSEPTDITYQRYQETGWRCGAVGGYADDFLFWSCAHGHETRLTAEGKHHPRYCSHDRSTGYRMEGCLGHCPTRGLEVTYTNLT